MSAGLSFGSLPAFADLSPDQQAMVMQSLQARAAEQQQPGSPDQLLFNRAGMGGGPNAFQPQDNSPETTGATGREAHQSAPAIAMDEAAVRRLEQPMMPPVAGGNVPPVPQAAPPTQGGPVAPAVPQPTAGPAQPAPQMAPVNSFDPLTGQPTSGNPKPITPAGAAQATGQDGGGFMDRFLKSISGGMDPDTSNLLLNLGMGLMSKKGFGVGAAAGLDSYQKSQYQGLSRQLQQYQLLQQQQAQNATRAYLKGKGLPADQVEAAALNPAVLSSVQAQMNKDPTQMTVGGNVYLVPPGGRPGPDNLIGPSDGPPSGFKQTPNGLVPIEGGPQSIDYKKKVAEATASEKFLQVEQPDGSKKPYLVTQDEEGNTILQRPKGIPEETSSGNPYATGKFNSDQAKAAGFSDRMLGSEPILRKYETLNADNPYGATGATIANMAPNSMKSTERQQMDQAQRDFINSQLRRESGAAISPSEFDSARQQYFPQPGDQPEVIEQKRRNRQAAIEAMAREGGSAYRPKSVFDQSGNLVPFGQNSAPRPDTPAQPSRAQLEAEARRRGLIK